MLQVKYRLEEGNEWKNAPENVDKSCCIVTLMSDVIKNILNASLFSI